MCVLVYVSKALPVCKYICIYIYSIHTHIYINIFFFICIIQTHPVFFRSVHMRICTRLCVCAFRCVHMCVHARVHACECVWIHVCLRLSLNLRVPVKEPTNQNTSNQNTSKIKFYFCWANPTACCVRSQMAYLTFFSPSRFYPKISSFV